MKPWLLPLSVGWQMPSVCTSGAPPGRAGGDVRKVSAAKCHTNIPASAVSACRVPRPFPLCVGVDPVVLLPIVLCEPLCPPRRKRDNTHLGLLLPLKLSLGILRLFLGFSDDLKPSREGFALALSEVYIGLLLVDLDSPGLQLLLLDLDLVVERTGFVCQRLSVAGMHSTVK